jgi:hypothetical protein
MDNAFKSKIISEIEKVFKSKKLSIIHYAIIHYPVIH